MGLAPAQAKRKAKTKKVSDLKEKFIIKVMNAIKQRPNAKPKRKVSAKMKKRNDLIRKIMKKTGCSLAEASRFIKEQGLL